jgi:hypothetical protein
MSLDIDDVLKLRAAIEFGSEYEYSIKNGGLGRTLIIDAHIRKKAHEARVKIPSRWEGLYTLVIYNEKEEENEDEPLYDKNLT